MVNIKYLPHLPTLDLRRCCHRSHWLISFWSLSHNCFLCLVSERWRPTRVLEQKPDASELGCMCPPPHASPAVIVTQPFAVTGNDE